MNQPMIENGLFDLTGKVALVTGAGHGIGKATATLLAAAGATLVIADKDFTAAQDVAQQLGAAHQAVSFDLASQTSIEALFAQVADMHERLDILVNNAGIYPRFALDDVTQAQWEQMQHINVWGCFVVLREAARLMRQHANGGRIVNVSSIGAARTAVNDQVAYNASKAALDSVTQSAALEYAPHGILVNSILPGAVMPLDPRPKPAAHQPATGPLLSSGRMPLGRPAHAHEVAGPILMLVSAAGAYITGQTLIVDGGFSVT